MILFIIIFLLQITGFNWKTLRGLSYRCIQTFLYRFIEIINNIKNKFKYIIYTNEILSMFIMFYLVMKHSSSVILNN